MYGKFLRGGEIAVFNGKSSLTLDLSEMLAITPLRKIFLINSQFHPFLICIIAAPAAGFLPDLHLRAGIRTCFRRTPGFASCFGLRSRLPFYSIFFAFSLSLFQDEYISFCTSAKWLLRRTLYLSSLHKVVSFPKLI